MHYIVQIAILLEAVLLHFLIRHNTTPLPSSLNPHGRWLFLGAPDDNYRHIALFAAGNQKKKLSATGAKAGKEVVPSDPTRVTVEPRNSCLDINWAVSA